VIGVIKLQVLCSKGDSEFEAQNVTEAEELLAKVDLGEIEGVNKGKYYIIDKATNQIVGRRDIQEGQMLVVVPVIAGG
jgi:hypothetical protein